MELTTKNPIEAHGAEFTFGNWTLDAVNGTFYPYAVKTLLEVSHTPGGSYVKNFYTADPNFTGPEGIEYATINASYEPVLPQAYGWMAAGDKTYCIENTMSAAEQRFNNATRIVVKGTYYPAEHTTNTGDWFSFGGIPYLNFAALKAAYNDPLAGSGLKEACVRFYGKVYDYLDAKGESVGHLTEFDDLETTDLGKVTNGGEVVKEGLTPVIRWYQGGLCYYYNEIRHDNETDKEMAFAKYGVVRNNWYSVMVGEVSGPGTPWYPDINNPGPGDPGTTDPIDESTGYLGVTVTVAKWIIWNKEIVL